uniref:Small ArfGAP 1 n=1 Tax=Buteo japonicus TaxID=224669 RepID=A0A8C0BZP4_9AVES
AGIHRNLGVHISRVKSVNLDQWTPEQIQCMQEMGNTKARLLYEANLPENFRRPQTDQAVEFFIRDKYEKKKYYDKNAVNAFNVSKQFHQEFCHFSFLKSSVLTFISQSTSTKPAAATLSAASGDLDLFTEQTTKSEESAKKQLSKDSILSLYGTGTMQQQNYPTAYIQAKIFIFSTGMMGNVMGQSVPVMGQSTGVMVGMGMPNGFTGATQTGVMGLPQNVVGPQGGMVGQMVTPQNKYGLQQSQQAPWNLSQMNQQMAGMNLSSSSNVMGFGQPPSTAAGWTGSSSGQTLSTQLWK